MGFGTGLLTGLATSIERGVRQNIDMNMEDLSNAKKYMRARDEQEDARYRKQLKEYEDTVKDLARFVDTSTLPQGATAYDVAGAYMEKMGGSLTAARSMVEELQKSTVLGADAPKLIFDKANQMGYSASDVARMYTDPKDLAYIRGGEQKGTGFFFKGMDIRAKAEESLAMPTIQKQMDRSGLGTAKVSGKLLSAEEYTREKETSDIALKQARLTLQKTEKDIADMGGLDETAGRMYLKDVLAKAATNKGFEINVDGTPDFKTTGDKLQDSKDAFSDALINATNYFNSTGTTKKTSGKNQLYGFVSANLPFATKEKAQIVNGQLNKDIMEIGKIYSWKSAGQNVSGVYLGPEFGADDFLMIPGF
jgi:hypothetical protein